MEVLRDSRLALRELVVEAGLGVFQELLEEDRERLCGRRHERFADREATSSPSLLHTRGRRIIRT